MMTMTTMTTTNSGCQCLSRIALSLFVSLLEWCGRLKGPPVGTLLGYLQPHIHQAVGCSVILINSVQNVAMLQSMYLPINISDQVLAC